MNIANLLSNAQFSEKYILQKLIMEYMKCTREEMRTEGEKEIPQELYDKIIRGYKLSTEDQMPLDYILGHVTFFGNEFIVNENTLVPRPETEYMVQAVTEHIKENKNQDIVVMDIGTGCGVL
ncbi:TPA: hypothetical protein DIC40_01130 [Patescibacteria group bacterium]|nr:hypothetical protein [Candidatus Gracilibacteria bacterium]